MTLEVGAKAPAFTLLDDAGARVSSAALRGTPVVLFFYPEADTPACTQQACGFRDEHAAFVSERAAVFGISPDPVERLALFRAKHGFPYALLSDPEHAVAARYDAYGEKLMYGRKVTGTIRSSVVIDENGVVAGVFRNVRTNGNARRMLQFLRSRRV